MVGNHQPQLVSQLPRSLNLPNQRFVPLPQFFLQRRRLFGFCRRGHRRLRRHGPIGSLGGTMLLGVILCRDHLVAEFFDQELKASVVL